MPYSFPEEQTCLAAILCVCVCCDIPISQGSLFNYKIEFNLYNLIIYTFIEYAYFHFCYYFPALSTALSTTLTHIICSKYYFNSYNLHINRVR